jgi:hypothetical protein
MDEKIRKITESILRNLRVYSSFVMGTEVYLEIERKVYFEVDSSISIPASSIEGIYSREKLIDKLILINNYSYYIILSR